MPHDKKPTVDLEDLSDDTRDLLTLYTNLRRNLVQLTSAGPLMEVRTGSSKKIDKNERVSHHEATRVTEQIRMFFHLRKMLAAAGVRLELSLPASQAKPAPQPEPAPKGRPAPERVVASYFPQPPAAAKAPNPCLKTPPPVSVDDLLLAAAPPDVAAFRPGRTSVTTAQALAGFPTETLY